MFYFNPLIGLIFIGLLALGYGYFALTGRQREAAPLDEMLVAAAPAGD